MSSAGGKGRENVLGNLRCSFQHVLTMYVRVNNISRYYMIGADK